MARFYFGSAALQRDELADYGEADAASAGRRFRRAIQSDVRVPDAVSVQVDIRSGALTGSNDQIVNP